MELLKLLGRRIVRVGRLPQSWGLFVCPYCGKHVERLLGNGKRNQSCGCYHYKGNNLKHGKSRTPLYGVWLSMKFRCSNNKAREYPHYGGRGISVCREWREDYLSFERWATENGYYPGLEIDRIDNDGGYEPGNCRFTNRQTNMRNTRRTRMNGILAGKMRFLFIEEGISKSKLGKMFGVSAQHAGRIIEGRYW